MTGNKDGMEEFRRQNPKLAGKVEKLAHDARDGAEEILESIQLKYGDRPFEAATVFNRMSSNLDALLAIIAMLLHKGPPPAVMLDPMRASTERACERIMESGIELVALACGPEEVVKGGLKRDDIPGYMKLVNAANKRLEQATIDVLSDTL